MPSIFGKSQKDVMYAKHCLEQHERGENNAKRRCPIASDETKDEEPQRESYQN